MCVKQNIASEGISIQNNMRSYSSNAQFQHTAVISGVFLTNDWPY